MPTFKKCVNVGRKIPQVQTDDIANHSVTCPKLGHDVWDEIASKIQVVEDHVSELAEMIPDTEGGSGSYDDLKDSVVSNTESISEIKQNAEEISLSVGNNAGDIAALNVRADGIESSVRNTNGNITLLQQEATFIRAIATDAKDKASEAILNADGISTRVTSLEEEFDNLATGGEVNLTGYVKKTDYETYKTQTAEQIESTATQIETIQDSLGGFVSQSEYNSQITQTAQQIEASVSASKIYTDTKTNGLVKENAVASIAMSAVAPDGSLKSDIKIKADQIDLTGNVAISGGNYQEGGATEISGSSIVSKGQEGDYVREAEVKEGSIALNSGNLYAHENVKETDVTVNGLKVVHTHQLYDISKGIDMSVGNAGDNVNNPNSYNDVSIRIWQNQNDDKHEITLSPKAGLKFEVSNIDGGINRLEYIPLNNSSGHCSLKLTGTTSYEDGGDVVTEITESGITTNSIATEHMNSDTITASSLTIVEGYNTKTLLNGTNAHLPKEITIGDAANTPLVGVTVAGIVTGSDRTITFGAEVSNSTKGKTNRFVFNGNINATGAVTQNSDMTMKDVVRDTLLDCKTIADAPLFYYTWKKDLGRDEELHVGTSAQYWKETLPTEVYGEEGDMAIDYAKVSMASVISLAREVERLKAEIAELKNK